jgi:hypothetical protein
MYEEENIESEFLKGQKKNPFRTPEGYFDSLEDRILAGIEPLKRTKTTSTRIFQFLKPALGLAASFLLVALLVYSPVKTLLLKNNIKTEVAQSSTTDVLDDYSLNLTSIDENVLASAIFSDESNTQTIDADEMLAYLSSDLNDVEIYSEIQN